MPMIMRNLGKYSARVRLHPQGIQATIKGRLAMLSSACLHADNMLDADSSVGLTSGYGGNSYDAAWVQDPDVGFVIECNKVGLPLPVLHKL